MRLRFLLLSSMLITGIGAGLGLAVLSLPNREDVARQMSFDQKVRTYLIANPELFDKTSIKSLVRISVV